MTSLGVRDSTDDILRTTLGGQNMEGGSDMMRSVGGNLPLTVLGLRVDEPVADADPFWDAMVMHVCDGAIAEPDPDRDRAGATCTATCGSCWTHPSRQ